MKVVPQRATVLALGALTALAVSACSNSSTATETTARMSEEMSAAMSATPLTSPASAAPAALVGTGCAAYAELVPSGPGSVAGMATDPVTVAASNNPMLKTLTQALSGQLNPGVNLVQTLDGGEFTVFAPTDDAFAKIDAATLGKLKTDAPLLKSILTYHVVPGRVGPAQVAGQHTTVQGATLRVTGSGDTLKVNDAGLVCGGVNTANATVYLIDTVLMPPA